VKVWEKRFVVVLRCVVIICFGVVACERVRKWRWSRSRRMTIVVSEDEDGGSELVVEEEVEE
jgi:hypothetical protein